MEVTIESLGIDKLSVADRLRLVREICESIENEVAPTPLTDEQRREIDRRLANHAANPSAAIPWEEVEAAALARVSRK
jgi:putative addiction module component (TIGR02574 family)